MKSRRRARRASKQQRSAKQAATTATPPPAFTELEEAFFAAGVAASESGQFGDLSEEAEPARPGLLRRFLLRVQRA